MWLIEKRDGTIIGYSNKHLADTAFHDSSSIRLWFESDLRAAILIADIIR